MNLLIAQFSPGSCYFLPLRSKYSAEHPVHSYPQSMFSRLSEKPSFIPEQKIKVCSPLYIQTRSARFVPEYEIK
jgi:hypothetical protein